MKKMRGGGAYYKRIEARSLRKPDDYESKCLSQTGVAFAREFPDWKTDDDDDL